MANTSLIPSSGKTIFVQLPSMSGASSCSLSMQHSFVRLDRSDGYASARTGPPVRNEQCARIGSFSSIFMPGNTFFISAIAFSSFSINIS